MIWKTLDPIQTHGGLRLLPDTTLADCPKLDVICVPGGSGVVDLMDDPEVLIVPADAGRGSELCRLDLHRIAGAGCGGTAARQEGDDALGLDWICWCRWGQSRQRAVSCVTASSSPAAALLRGSTLP